MARAPKGTPRKYPTKAQSGQARLTVRLLDGRRHDIYLGAFRSPDSRAEYRRVLAELETNGGRYPQKENGTVHKGLTVSELCLRFWKHAEAFYRLANPTYSHLPPLEMANSWPLHLAMAVPKGVSVWSGLHDSRMLSR